MANDILKTLQSMEEELAAIKSAKEQVEEVVAADAAINRSIKSYSSSLTSLSMKLVEVKTCFQDVVNVVSDETNKFNSSLDKRKNDIEAATQKLSELLVEFRKQTEIIGIQNIAAKSDHIATICDNLSNKLNDIDSKLYKTRTEIVQVISSNSNDFKQDILSTKTAVIVEIDKKVSAVGSNMASTESNIKSAISSVNSTILNKIDASKTAHDNIVKEEMETVHNGVKSMEVRLNGTITATGRKFLNAVIVLIILVIINIILNFI